MEQIDQYLISYDPIPTEGLATLDPEARAEYDELYEKALKQPKEMLSKIEDFQKRYPNLPEIENLLAVVYLYLKQIDKVEQLIEASYKKFPRYLFARINYADQCLRKNKPHLVPDIFEKTFELKTLYPSKKHFHVSEFRGFMVFMGLYHLALKDRTKAEHYYHLANRADPKHPSVLSLEKKIYSISFIKKLFRKLNLR